MKALMSGGPVSSCDRKVESGVGRGPRVPALGDIPASFSSLALHAFLKSQIVPDSHF